MYGCRRPRSPRASQTEQKVDEAGESRSDSTPWNPTKRLQVEQDPRAGAQPAAAAPGAGSPDPTANPETPHGPQPPSPHVIAVVLEPGTDLQVRLGDDEALTLGPESALQLSLRNVVVVVVQAHVLGASQHLSFGPHAQFLLLRGTDTTWTIDIDDGSISAQRAGEAPWGLQPAGSPASLSTLFLRPRYRASAAPQGCSALPKPRPPRPLPTPFLLGLQGLGTVPGSELRPLPPSPSPGPRTCRAASRRPPTKTRRRLF